MKKLTLLGIMTLLAVSASTGAFAKPHGGKRFDKADTNGDGVISKSEFDAKSDERFKKMDIDGDGQVTKEEAKEGHKKFRQKMKEMREKRDQLKNTGE